MRMSVSEVNTDGIHLFTAILRDVTNEKEGQARLDKEQRKTAAIMDSALNAILTTDSSGTIELVNTSACRVFRQESKEAFLGFSLADLIEEADGRPVSPEDIAAFLAEMSGKVKEMTGRRADGSTFPMRMSVSEVNTDGIHLFTAILRDVTNEKETQARLDKEQRKTSAILNSALNAIITTDRDGAIELANSSACQVFKVSHEETVGSNLSGLLLREDGSPFGDTEMAAFLKGMSGTVQEILGRRRDGSQFPVRMSVSEVDTDGLHLYTVILRDVTSEKEAQAKIQAAHHVIALERSKLKALLDATVEGFIVTNSTGIIESFNKAAEGIFGYATAEVMGKNISMFMPANISSAHASVMRRHVKDGSGAHVLGHSREITAVKKDGTEFPCLISIAEAVVDGEHLFTATIRDLSNELLLMNMLPSSIAERLRTCDEPIHDKHDSVSILFADIVGFTALSSKLTPFEVVSFLNDIFHIFDELADIYRLEKIKTIGDCYMVVAGVPEWDEDHALRCACFALEMRQALIKYNRSSNLKVPLNMRIGIHCGPVIAGVVGKRKILYDIWGDAVNTASRMESTGIAGEIQVSDDFQKQTCDWFLLRTRGQIDVKGKGKMKTHILWVGMMMPLSASFSVQVPVTRPFGRSTSFAILTRPSLLSFRLHSLYPLHLSSHPSRPSSHSRSSLVPPLF